MLNQMQISASKIYNFNVEPKIPLSMLIIFFLQETKKSGFLMMLDTKLKELSVYLGTRPWFAGEKVSACINLVLFA